MTSGLQLARTDDPVPPPRVARFGVFELDLRSAELRRDGVLIKLQEQPFRLLVFLLEHAGEVVTREEVRKTLWPSEFVDFDHSLNTAVRKLRAALDDSAENPRFVETLARRGYRFIAPVSWSGAEPMVAQPESRTRAIAAGLVLAVLAISILGFLMARADSPRKISDLAVLPFVNSDAKSEHVSDGLTEILIDRLSRLSSLRVMARGTVFDYKRKKIAPAEAGKELGVGAVVTGQLRAEGDGYAIHVELIDVRDGAQLWGQSYTASAAELPSIQDRIAGDLSHQLREGKQPKFVACAYTKNAEANEQYLLGLQAWNARGRNVVRSIEFFQRAIQLDPNFAAAYSGLANGYGVMAGNGMMDPKEGAINVLTAAEKALAIDPNNAEAYTSIATTKYRALFDFAGADRDYRRSLEHNPNYATGHQWYSEYLREMGRIDEARREIELARQLDPLSRAINAATCWGLTTETRYAEAIAFARRSEKLGYPMPLCVMRATFDAGDDKAMRDEFFRYRDDKIFGAMFEAYEKGGRRAFLEKRIELFKEQPGFEFAYPVDIAETYAMLGRNDEAFAWLDKAVEKRATHITSFHLFSGFDGVRDDPRFIVLAHRIGLPEASLKTAREFAAKRAAMRHQ